MNASDPNFFVLLVFAAIICWAFSEPPRPSGGHAGIPLVACVTFLARTRACRSMALAAASRGFLHRPGRRLRRSVPKAMSFVRGEMKMKLAAHVIHPLEPFVSTLTHLIVLLEKEDN